MTFHGGTRRKVSGVNCREGERSSLNFQFAKLHRNAKNVATSGVIEILSRLHLHSILNHDKKEKYRYERLNFAQK